MFNKLKQHLNQITKKKTILDEFEDKGFEIDLNNLWKYPPQDLHGMIMNYEKFLEKIRKKGADMQEENLANKEKITQFENEKNQINLEKQQLKSQLEHFYSVVELESKEKERLKSEVENFKSERNNIENSQKSDRSQGLKTDENYEFATPKIQEMLNDSQKAFEYLLNEISSTELNNNLKSLRDKINSKIENKTVEEINLMELLQEINSKNLIFEILAEKTKEHIDNFKSSTEKFSEYIAETKNKNQIDSKEKQELLKKNESLSLTLEKSEKIRTDLENDLMKMSERIAGLKSDNVTLNSNLNETKQKLKNEEKLREDFFIQNKAYAEEIKMMKDKISSVVMEKSKMEESTSNDLREQKNLLETCKNTCLKLEETLKEKEEANLMRQRDLENKIIQERLKLDQKMKDLTKFEELYGQSKTDLTQQIESNNKLMEKISLLEMKMTSDKKLFKEERKKNKLLSKQLSELQSKNWNENDEREQKIHTLEKEKGEMIKEINEAKRKVQNEFSKEIEIKNLEIKIAELSNEISELKEKMSLYEDKISESENLKLGYQSEIKNLQNKREAALEEIHRLNEKIAKTTKPEKVEITFDRLNKSQQSNKEQHFIAFLKKDMENVYREYIQILPLEKNNDYLNGFIKIEKKLNDVIRRSQDYIDNLEGN